VRASFGVMRRAGSSPKFCALASLLIPLLLVLISAVTRRVGDFYGGDPLATRFHVGVFYGALWFHSDSLPFGAISVWRLIRAAESDPSTER
jgi:hypothetical protein